RVFLRAEIEELHRVIAARVTAAFVDLGLALRGDAGSALRVGSFEAARAAEFVGRHDEHAADEGGNRANRADGERAHQKLAVVVVRTWRGRRKAVITAAAPSTSAPVEIHEKVRARSAAAPASSTRQKSRAARQF